MTPSFDLVPQSAALDDVVAEAQRLIRAARASSSIAAYESDFRLFASWAAQHGLEALPATGSTVALYAAALSALHLAPATIKRRLASIATIHVENGYTHRPASCCHTPLGEIMRGIRRTRGVAPQQAKRPILTEDLRRILAACPDSLLGRRDRALLGISFSGAFRRSETIALPTADLDFLEVGVVVRLNRSKSDPYAAGRLVGIPRAEDESLCPVRALQIWLEAAHIASGPVFRAVDRHGQVAQNHGLGEDSIARIVKAAAKRAGYGPGELAHLSSHSLRSGHVTSAVLYGNVSESTIMRQTGHTTESMVRRYTKLADVFRRNSASALGL